VDFKEWVWPPSQWLDERVEHVMGVQAATYKERYRPDAGIIPQWQSLW